MKYVTHGQGIVEIKSGQKGPRIGLVCNVHGNELCGRKAVHRVLKKYEIVAGSLFLIDGNQEAALLDRRFVKSDMNRMFTEKQLAKANAKDDLARAQYLANTMPKLKLDQIIDFHSTSSEMKHAFSVCFPEAGHLADMVPVVPIYGFKGIVKGTLIEWMNDLGVPSLVVETGEHYSTKAVNIAEHVVLSVLSHYGLITLKEPLKQKKRPSFEVLEHVKVRDAESFTLTREYASFDKLEPNELIAHDKKHEYRVPDEKGLYILMPAVQENVRKGISPGAYYLMRKL
ncbi:MAG: succinylglutamate desuccinylase/aspartoacylase family protein [Rhizobiaceae bacterium]|nr:succinylglutamate desuccinylase/aspartoacylase family protein [Rhizobiaceae bacterium]